MTEGDQDPQPFDVDHQRIAEEGAALTARETSRDALREAMLDMEEPLADLRSALAALDLVASSGQGIERGDMVGLRFIARHAREHAEAASRCWSNALRHIDDGGEIG